MANIVDYVRWRGDISLEERKFNLVDNLVFCHLGYLDMTEIFTDRKSATIAQIWDKLDGKAKFRLFVTARKDRDLLEESAHSERFGDIVVTDYVDNTDVKENKQFAAVTFELDKDNAIVVFRGTDDTIVGWKEDFMISYTRVPAQKQALEYAKRAVSKYENIYIAGHSKGANLALYASSHLPASELKKVKKIFLNDGPGFCKDVLDTDLIKKVDGKCVRITPEYCIVGAIFEPDITESYIVKSEEIQMLQHNLTSWMIEGDRLVLAREHDPSSVQINSLFDKFIEKMDDLGDRQAFVNSIFDTMGQNGAITIEEFMKGGPKAFENLIITVVGDDENGLNPLKSVKDNVVSDIKNSPIGKAVEDKKDKKTLIRIVSSFIFAFFCYIIPESFIKTVFAVAIFLVVFYQLYLTVYHLKKSKWDITKEKIRINVSIVLIVAYAVLIVKDDALFLFASILFGVIFLASSYQCFVKRKNARDDKLRKNRYLFEGIMLFIFGGYLMVGPDVGLNWYTISCGSFVLMDAIFEIIHIRRMRKQGQYI